MRKKFGLSMHGGKLPSTKASLPLPHELAPPGDNIKVTLALSRRSITFFKAQARVRRTKYQRMIRELVDRYVVHYISSPS